jgi:hypothetical protein
MFRGCGDFALDRCGEFSQRCAAKITIAGN